MTGWLAGATIAVGVGWLTTVRRHDADADTPIVPRSQIAVEALLFAVTLGLGLGTVASLLGGGR